MDFLRDLCNEEDTLEAFCTFCQIYSSDLKRCPSCKAQFPKGTFIYLLRQDGERINVTGLRKDNMPQYTFFPLFDALPPDIKPTEQLLPQGELNCIPNKSIACALAMEDIKREMQESVTSEPPKCAAKDPPKEEKDQPWKKYLQRPQYFSTEEEIQRRNYNYLLEDGYHCTSRELPIKIHLTIIKLLQELHDTRPHPWMDKYFLTIEDLKRLLPLRWLNGELINFYLQYLREEKFKDHPASYITYSTYFYPSLLKFLSQQGRVFNPRLNYRVKQNIFEKDFLIIPINYNNSHWVCLVICHLCVVEKNLEYVFTRRQIRAGIAPGSKSSSANYIEDQKPFRHVATEEKMPCILVFDSLEWDIPIFFDQMRRYLQYEYYKNYNVRVNFDELPGYFVPCPQQDNESDCGVFTLHFAEKFLENSKLFQGYPPDLRCWFTVETIRQKRLDILELVANMAKMEKEKKKKP